MAPHTQRCLHPPPAAAPALEIKEHGLEVGVSPDQRSGWESMPLLFQSNLAFLGLSFLG